MHCAQQMFELLFIIDKSIKKKKSVMVEFDGPKCKIIQATYIYMLFGAAGKFKICILKEAASKCSSSPLEVLDSLK